MIKSIVLFICILTHGVFAFGQDTIEVNFGVYSKVTANSYGPVRFVLFQNDTIYNSGKPYVLKFPKNFTHSDTAFTTIYFTGCPNSVFDREIGVLIGDYKSKKPTIYIDRNGNNNFSDDGMPINMQDSTVDLYLENIEDPSCRFGVRWFYPNYDVKNQEFLSQMGPLARENKFASILNWTGEYRLNNRVQTILIDGIEVQIGLHDYNCNGTYNDVGKDKVIFGNRFDNSISTRLQHGAIVISDTTRVLINGVVYDVRDIAKDGGALTLIECKDACSIKKKIQNGMKLTHTALTTLDSNKIYLDEIQEVGKFMLIDVWGLWCKGCLHQLPRLEEMYKEHQENLQIVSLNWGDKPNSVFKFLGEKPSLWADQCFANKEFLNHYMVDSYPNYILVGKDGVIIKLGTNLTEVQEIISKY